jgi:hypothetical protein
MAIDLKTHNIATADAGTLEEVSKMGAHATELGTPALARGGEGQFFTVEGRLTMVDFAQPIRHCRIEPESGEPVACTFDAYHDRAILEAVTRRVRVTGEYVASRRKSPDLRIKEVVITLTSGENDTPRMAAAPTLDGLAAEQGKTGPTDLAKLMRADFWPEDEDTEEFVGTVRKWRNEE